jgi:L-ascorbate metabolism protein UlaG (beta-lactamase superfamily)
VSGPNRFGLASSLREHRGGITFVGHSTLLIELDGTRLLTDPILRMRLAHIRRIVPPPPASTADRLDAILISHAHHDHLDVPSLKRLPGDVRVIAPPGCATLMRRRIPNPVVEVLPGARLEIGDVAVVAIHAEHDGRRYSMGPPLPAIGYVIEGSSRVAFFGDTDLFDGMRDIAGELDVALLPIWGWGPRVPEGHLDPERAAHAVGLLHPRIVIPIHWGTLAGPRVWWRDDPAMPARQFTELVAQHAPGVTVKVLSPGESLALAPA